MDNMLQQNLNQLSAFQKLSFITLIELFTDHYVKYYGKELAKASVQKAAESVYIDKYLKKLKNKRELASGSELLKILQKVIYFTFIDSETICLASIHTIKWNFTELTSMYINSFYATGEIIEIYITEEEKSKVIADTIVKCSNLKTNINRSFYDLFFKQIASNDSLI